ncbi:MAG: prolipoprotein diacylglyceryl transferase [Rhodospirillaceae bacterium]|jgi:phosphatidylglycerol:prolipoprotein diacylglycerol transferase|nr:prolipoprotein diacylglyceryl transferase [Rhodospirillaceae bacterium]MBT6405065.1 prolipoprotein diacylglyceryl transferase [Rhodospirillaceae bacterium]MBT6535174.1 prolipoprotein diacylglyceryl transferase [Rhodospirillaceae bacterium]MBT7361549.1 prolipoprotein diacylglyceryl transferase [Rhodospirillaceae bacterium]
MTGPIPFPEIDPVAFAIGPFVVRWYALAFIAGLLAGWGYMVTLLRRPPVTMTSQQVGDFFSWAIVGVIVGGRLGFVGFYQLDFFLANPLQILAVWNGGMSFHGGLLGVIVAIILYARRYNILVLTLGDLVAAAAPIGLFLGRLANFINGELYGRATDVPWAVVFPDGGDIGRHPSQLYEAGLEGLLLFVILFALARFARARYRPGLLTGVFLLGYGSARTFVEFFRQPDNYVGDGGFLLWGSTIGQWLSTPIAIAGLIFIVYAVTHDRLDNNRSAAKPAQ